MAEGGTLEKCYTGNGIVSSNLTLTALDFLTSDIAPYAKIRYSIASLRVLKTHFLEDEP